MKEVLTISIGNVANLLAGLKITSTESNIKSYQQPNQINMTQSYPDYKSPTTAFLLSFLIAGMGQHYNGDHALGAVLNVFYIGGIVVAASTEFNEGDATTIGLSVAGITWLYAIIDAPTTTTEYNKKLKEQFSHQFEFDYNNAIFGMDFGINKNAVGGQLTVHF